MTLFNCVCCVLCLLSENECMYACVSNIVLKKNELVASHSEELNSPFPENRRGTIGFPSVGLSVHESVCLSISPSVILFSQIYVFYLTFQSFYICT